MRISKLHGWVRRVVGGTLAGVMLAGSPLQACTVFVLTNGAEVLFFNNEDWLNPKTRIWFVPAGEGHLGCVYVGFDDGFAQGGMNTAGLAFDAVAGYEEEWQPRDLKPVRGNPSQRMLETCATVEEAIAFYRRHIEPDFTRAKIMVADRSGASAIIGARNGKLQVEQKKESRGFGYGWRTVNEMLSTPPEPTVANGVKILRACKQEGEYATKYSNVFDLKTGDIHLFGFSQESDGLRMNLGEELARGAHYFDLPNIREQLGSAPQPLLASMRRFPMDEYQPITDSEPDVTAKLGVMFQEAREGKMNSRDYNPAFWERVGPKAAEVQRELEALGEFVGLKLVARGEEKGKRSYRYKVEFTKAWVLQHYLLDEQARVAFGHTELFEWKPGHGPGF